MRSVSFIHGLFFLLISLAQGTTLDRALASLESLMQPLKSVQQASRNYNGGITSTTNLVLAAYRLDRTVQNIANAFDGLGQLGPDGVERWEDVYRQLLPTASETANSFADMGPEAERMGYAPYIPAFTQIVETRTNLFFDSMYRVMPEANSSLVVGVRQDVQQVFQGVRARLGE